MTMMKTIVLMMMMMFFLNDEKNGKEEEQEEPHQNHQDGDTDSNKTEEKPLVWKKNYAPDVSSEDEWENPNGNTVGNIPMEYYDDYDHIGYNIFGEKIAKPVRNESAIDQFLLREEDPSTFVRTVYDKLNGKDVVISKDDFKVIMNLMQKRYPEGFDAYQPFEESEDPDKIHPVTNRMMPKSHFVPSKWEAKKNFQISSCYERRQNQNK